MSETLSGNRAGTLLDAARDCLGYAPGAGDVDEWRQAFDRLADLKREAERSLIRSDRDRLAAIVAELAVLSANCEGTSGRVFLAEVARALAGFAADDGRFLPDGNFVRGDHG